MTVTRTHAPAVESADDVQRAAVSMRPMLTQRAADIEAARRLPPDVLDHLIDAGCFRVLLPRSHGGVGADFPDALRVFEALARAEASVGWTVMIGASAWCDLAALPKTTFDALLAGGADTIMAGAFNPTGAITPVDGGYRVSGRWGFASGCEHATWLWGNCVESVVDGVPALRVAVFRREEAVIEDTWNVSGLAGTGSHHFHVDDLFVPAEWTFVPLVDPPRLDAAIARVPAPALFALGIASVALGTAQGAIDEVIDLASSKVALLASGPVAASPLFQFELATCDTGLRAARALLFETAASVWQRAVDGTPLTLAERGQLRAAAVWITEQATTAVDAAYRSGGGTSLYTDCSLQRRLRDIHALTQHFLVRRDTLTTSGAILAGQDVAVMVF